MTTRNKIIYLEQTIYNKHYDDKIYSLYEKIIKIKQTKINKLKCYGVYNSIVEDNLSILYNNLTDYEINIIEGLFSSYYDETLKESTIIKSQLYLNSIERFNLEENLTNKILPYKSYSGIISGLNVFNFSLQPLEYQPSGYCNFSELKPEFKLTLSKTLNNEIIKQHFFARSYNIIRFMSGLCGIAW